MKKLLLVLSALALTVTMSLAAGKCGQGKCGGGDKVEKKCDASQGDKKCNADKGDKKDMKSSKCSSGKK